jgi:hypothetical protein
VLEDDDQFEFEFKLTEDEYFAIVKELRAKDPDLIEIDEVLVKCDHEGCKKMFKNKKALLKHTRRKHGKGEDEEPRKEGTDDFAICHLCGKDVKVRSLSLHIKNHE